MTSQATPAYRHIYDRLHEQLRDGLYPPGERLPSERQLAADLQVSRMTARAAVELLVQRGLVERRERSGIYAARPKIEQVLSSTAGLSQQLLQRGVIPGAKVVSFSRLRAGEVSPEVGAALCLGPVELVFRLVRLRTGNGELLALEESFFPARLCGELGSADLTDSVYDWLEAHQALRVGRSRQELEPGLLSPEDALSLSTHPNSPVLRLIRTAWSEAGVPFEYARDLYRADRIRFIVETVQSRASTVERGGTAGNGHA